MLMFADQTILRGVDSKEYTRLNRRMNSTNFKIPSSPDDLLYPAIFHAGKAYFLERSTKRQASYFGGPIDPAVAFTGVQHGSRRLHHILKIDGDCFQPMWHVPGGHHLHLVYGMCFGGGNITYRSKLYEIEVLEMNPAESSEDFPYHCYPDLLPYLPMRLQACVDCTLEEFSQVSCQPLELISSEAIVIVPPSPVLGMSLWGPSGDAEGVQIVFRCMIERHGIVMAANQCG
jgi:hypothetical protein